MKLIDSRERYRCPIFWVTEDTLAARDGKPVKRAVVRHAGSAVVLPIDAEGRLMLIRQYRWPAKRVIWELCAGRIDPGETPLAAAKRELREETGLRARRWQRATRFYASPGFLDEQMNLYIATELTQGPRESHEDEEIDVHWFTAAQVRQMLAKGQIVDAKALIGVLLHLESLR